MSGQISVYLLAVKLLHGEDDPLKLKVVLARMIDSAVQGIKDELTVTEWAPEALEQLCADLVNIEISYSEESGGGDVRNTPITEREVDEFTKLLGLDRDNEEDDD